MRCAAWAKRTRSRWRCRCASNSPAGVARKNRKAFLRQALRTAGGGADRRHLEAHRRLDPDGRRQGPAVRAGGSDDCRRSRTKSARWSGRSTRTSNGSNGWGWSSDTTWRSRVLHPARVWKNAPHARTRTTRLPHPALRRRAWTTTLVRQFRGLASSNVADAMGRFNFMDPGIQSRSGLPLCGLAVTVNARPADNLMVHKALQIAQPGDIVVVSTGGNTTSAVFGELMCRTAVAAQARRPRRRRRDSRRRRHHARSASPRTAAACAPAAATRTAPARSTCRSAAAAPSCRPATSSSAIATASRSCRATHAAEVLGAGPRSSMREGTRAHRGDSSAARSSSRRSTRRFERRASSSDAAPVDCCC